MMNRVNKAKARKIKRAILITAKDRGYRNAVECYHPYSGATNGLRTDEMLAYERGYDIGLRESY